MRTYLYLAVWLHALRHLDVFEARLAACLPELAITRPRREPVAAQARWTPARPDGRRLRSIPLKLWPDQPAAQAQTAIVDRLRRSP